MSQPTENPSETTARMWAESKCDHKKGRGTRWTGGSYCLGCGLPEPKETDGRIAPVLRLPENWRCDSCGHVAPGPPDSCPACDVGPHGSWTGANR